MPDKLATYMGKIPPPLASLLLKFIKRLPPVKQQIEKEYDGMMKELEDQVKPYKGKVAAYTHIPDKGCNRDGILAQMEEMGAMEMAKWRQGFASGAVYHGDNGHIDFLNRVYALNSQSNPLHVDIWPSAVKFEAEVVSMTANMLGAKAAGPATGEICGTVTSGGTESILLAMKTYRDWARDTKGITKPEMIVPSTAHAAFDKAAQYFNIQIIHIP
ncbi:MAG TPA: aspartate aminotransferase family protein, partial [Dehalococcoidia bacterium]|nr:aspartate aminotransferase family protein [Dehalococcoidia bacterium]